jgi:hypothetical protein
MTNMTKYILWTVGSFAVLGAIYLVMFLVK